MRAQVITFVITALFASAASGQTARVLYYTHAETMQDIQEIATVIRSMTDMRQISTATAPRSLAVRGTADQIALAEWLFSELDRPANRQALMREYRPSTSGDDWVRVFFLAHTETPQDLQEVATLVRSIADIRRVFSYTAPRAVIARGTAGQMALAEWLLKELDNPGQSQNSAVHEYRMSDTDANLVRLFYLTRAETPQRLQEIATQVRSRTEIRRLFTVPRQKAVVLRGTPEQIALADGLIKEGDK